MILTVVWDGAHRPFEGDISIPVEVIPHGARIQNARIEVEPIDPGNSYVETISFAPGGLTWGANKVKTAGFVEVDFRARRVLAGVHGVNLGGANLQIDLGGAYLEINDHGAIFAPQGDTRFAVPAGATDVVLPSFTAVKVKFTSPTNASPDLSSVNIRSVPENVSLKLGDNPPFHTFTGPLTVAKISSDFATLLQEFLDSAVETNGHFTVPIGVHSDTIARLKLTVSFDILQVQEVLPAGVNESVLSYSFNSVPAGAAATLPLSLPPTAHVVSGETSVALQGAFGDTRIVFGQIVPVVSAPDLDISSVPGRPEALSQKFSLTSNLAVTGIDLLIRATTVAAQVRVDLRDDVGGKPGLTSLLRTPISIDLAQKPSEQSQWVSVELPQELKLNANTMYWLTVQRSLGNAAWSVKAATDSPLLQTNDGGMSWRQAEAGAFEGYFRFRNVPASFTMPVHVFVGERDVAEEVSLRRYESLGRVNFTLDSPEFADTINRVLAKSSTTACQPVEHLDNGDFQDWLRIGDTPTVPQLAHPTARAVTMSHDGGVLYVLTSAIEPALFAVDPVCLQTTSLDVKLDPRTDIRGTPPPDVAGLAASSDGSRLIVHVRGRTWIIDLTANTLIGSTDDLALSQDHLAADDKTLYFFAPGTTLTTVTLEALEKNILSAIKPVPAFQPVPAPVVTAVNPGGLAVSGDNVYLLDTTAGTPPVNKLQVHSVGTPSSLREIPLTFNPTGIAVHPEHPLAYVGSVNKVGGTTTGSTIHIIDLATGVERVALRSFDAPNEITQLSMAPLSSAYLAVRTLTMSGVEIKSTAASLIGFGVPVPEVWQITAGTVAPICLPDPFRIGLTLGTPQNFASISQVVPASGGCLYEFSFWGLASADGAAGEILWRVPDCSSPRMDSVPVRALSPAFVGDPFSNPIPFNERSPNVGNLNSLPQLQFHRLRVTAPPGATAAEVRFRTTIGVVAWIDRASLRTVSPVIANADFLESDAGLPKGWTLQPAKPLGFSIRADNSGVTIANKGLEIVSVIQEVPVKSGAVLNVEFTGEVSGSGDDPFAQFAWQESNVAAATIVLKRDSPRLQLATINVPDGVSKADFSLVLAPGTELKMENLRVDPDARIKVPINIYAEAPGELSVRDIHIVTDKGPPVPPPVPPNGLCPSTKPGEDSADADCTHCPSCGKDHPGKNSQLVRTPAGRASLQAACVNCGTVVLRPVPVRTSLPTLVTTRTQVRPLLIHRTLIQPITTVTRSPIAVRIPAGSVSVRVVPGITEQEMKTLEGTEFNSVQTLAAATADELGTILAGVASERVKTLIANANSILSTGNRPMVVKADFVKSKTASKKRVVRQAKKKPKSLPPAGSEERHSS